MSEETSTIAAVADSFTEERALAAARDRGEPEWLLELRTEASRAFAACWTIGSPNIRCASATPARAAAIWTAT